MPHLFLKPTSLMDYKNTSQNVHSAARHLNKDFQKLDLIKKIDESISLIDPFVAKKYLV